jgi:hypothetical protein
MQNMWIKLEQDPPPNVFSVTAYIPKIPVNGGYWINLCFDKASSNFCQANKSNFRCNAYHAHDKGISICKVLSGKATPDILLDHGHTDRYDFK